VGHREKSDPDKGCGSGLKRKDFQQGSRHQSVADVQFPGFKEPMEYPRGGYQSTWIRGLCRVGKYNREAGFNLAR
jgi:hypothetical protein